jgi:hypothetical protein
MLMHILLRASDKTLYKLKQQWLYEMSIPDYPGGNVAKFTSDWRALRFYFLSMGHDVSDSLPNYIRCLIECPNTLFSQYFLTLEATEDPSLKSFDTASAKATFKYTELDQEGKYGVRSKAEQAAFKAQQRQPWSPSAHLATHDKRGFPIDRTPPGPNDPNPRPHPSGKGQQWFCANPYCQRWGNHPTEDHDAWRERLRTRRKAQQEAAASSTPQTEPTAAETPDTSSTTPSGNPLRVPRGTEGHT